nr:MAG TPA: Integrase [Caudoviricetes sp.]
MERYPTTRFVFDRKKMATNEKKALIQVEILFGGKKKYISTGVKVFKNQYNKKEFVCNCFEMVVLNKRINAVKERIDQYITDLAERGEPFTFDALEKFLSVENQIDISFIDFVIERIDSRTDLRPSTKKTQLKLISSLEEFGRIVNFSDITKVNIMAYDDFLHSKGIKQTTVYSYHKFMKTYIHDAMRRELLSTDPYTALNIKRGESGTGRYLSQEEYEAIRDADMPTVSLCHVRDLFIIQCLTGLSFSDLMSFDASMIKESAGTYYIADKRVKTGVDYCAVLLPEAMGIIKRYNGKLPKFSNQQYNMRLKIVAERAGVNKNVASHWGRRTCGMLLLNKGVSMEVVSRVLGHSSIKTTESVYAKLLPKTIVDEVVKASEK